MYPNNMICPIGPVAFNPYFVPMQMPMVVQVPVQMQPQQVVPNANQKQDNAQQNAPSVIYNVPKVSLYENNKPVSQPVKSDKVVEKQVENKNVETKAVEAKAKEDKRDAALAQVLAAQAGVQPPQPVQFKSSETVQKADDKKDVKKNKPQIVAPDTIKPTIDINGLISIMTSSDNEEQADALEAISEVTMYAPERAGELLDKKVVDALTGIMEKDTSSLEGEDKKLADRNKEYAMFTTATLQKLYADNIKELGKVDVPTEDLVGMKSIVKNLATNPNASVREAAVASLGYVKNGRNDVNSLIAEAAKDKSEVVRAQANRQLANA